MWSGAGFSPRNFGVQNRVTFFCDIKVALKVAVLPVSSFLILIAIPPLFLPPVMCYSLDQHNVVTSPLFKQEASFLTRHSNAGVKFFLSIYGLHVVVGRVAQSV